MKLADEPSRYIVGGELTFRGVTRTYEDEMEIEMVDGDTVRLEGQSTSTSATSAWNHRAF